MEEAPTPESLLGCVVVLGGGGGGGRGEELARHGLSIFEDLAAEQGQDTLFGARVWKLPILPVMRCVEVIFNND